MPLKLLELAGRPGAGMLETRAVDVLMVTYVVQGNRARMLPRCGDAIRGVISLASDSYNWRTGTVQVKEEGSKRRASPSLHTADSEGGEGRICISCLADCKVP